MSLVLFKVIQWMIHDRIFTESNSTKHSYVCREWLTVGMKAECESEMWTDLRYVPVWGEKDAFWIHEHAGGVILPFSYKALQGQWTCSGVTSEFLCLWWSLEMSNWVSSLIDRVWVCISWRLCEFGFGRVDARKMLYVCACVQDE